MGFNFSLFGENEHRQFNYKPRYYDVEKEERRGGNEGRSRRSPHDDKEKKEAQDQAAKDAAQNGSAAGQHKPGRYISGSFRDGNYQRTRKDTSKTQKIIGIVSLVLIFVVFIYIAKFYTFLLS
ncbi:MAG: hypothetical protein MJY92_08110 [Bacteroidales bacterium]|nr:hypothetical protein [Bacteroidales bacterium]